MAGPRVQALQQAWKAKQRARALAHFDVTRNGSATWRYCGWSRTTFACFQRRIETARGRPAGSQSQAEHDPLSYPAGGHRPDRRGAPGARRRRTAAQRPPAAIPPGLRLRHHRLPSDSVRTSAWRGIRPKTGCRSCRRGSGRLPYRTYAQNARTDTENKILSRWILHRNAFKGISSPGHSPV